VAAAASDVVEMDMEAGDGTEAAVQVVSSAVPVHLHGQTGRKKRVDCPRLGDVSVAPICLPSRICLI
jgi:hypothetical protein